MSCGHVKGKRRLYLVERRCAIEQDRDVVPERHVGLLTEEHKVDELVIELEIVVQFRNIRGGPIDTMDAMGDKKDAEP